MRRVDEIIEKLALEAHPEGGFYKETYRSSLEVSTELGPRNISTAIYFLLKSDQKSAFHRLGSDEFWYFHEGSSLEVYIIHPDGSLQKEILGVDLFNNERPQLLLPKGTWFAARCLNPETYTLISCSVAPGFQFEDFELAEKGQLLAAYPQHSGIIEQLTFSTDV